MNAIASNLLPWLCVLLVVLAVADAAAVFHPLVRLPYLWLVALLPALGLRWFLVAQGFLFQPERVRLLDITLATGILIIAGLLAYRGFTSFSWEQRVGFVATLIGLPVATFAALQFLVPPAPKATDLEACSGAPTAGSAYLAKTNGNGLNARSGPGTTYTPQRRFGEACLIGLDGYCVGEPVKDLLVPVLPDVRWTRLRHSHDYVTSGQVISLSPEMDLGNRPEASCPGGSGDPILQSEARIGILKPHTVTVVARPEGTPLVGFALDYDGDGTKPYHIEEPGITPKLVNGTGDVTASLDLTAIRNLFADPSEAKRATLAVVPCLAPIVPSHQGTQLFSINLKNGDSSRMKQDDRARQLERLQQAACRTDPDKNNADIEKKAQSGPTPPGI